MIADNLIIYAICVFILMIIGLVLTFLEFRYGEPNQQQKQKSTETDSNNEEELSR
jgi:hypothetical protein